MKKVIKIVTFYDDGTFTESTPYVGAPMPSIPMNPPFSPIPPEWPVKCPKCGIELKGAMGYVCNNYPCPTGLGGGWCSTGEAK